jgi:hypothetical protein
LFSGQKQLEDSLSKATVIFERVSREVESGVSFGTASQDPSQLLTALSECLGAQLEVLQLLVGSIEPPT